MASTSWTLESIEILPDYMEPQELESIFREIVEEKNLHLSVKASCFSELANRYWHTYEPCSPTLRDLMDTWIKQHIATLRGEDAVRAVFGVIGSLGLVRSYELLKAVDLSVYSDSIRAVFHENTIAETAEIRDPYRSLRKN